MMKKFDEEVDIGNDAGLGYNSDTGRECNATL